jgi:ribosomal protein L11 methyltransferase
MKQQTHFARVSADRAVARGLADLLTESLDPADIAIAIFEASGGLWTVDLYFAAAPDEAAIRNLVREIAGNDIARALTFGTMEARDWVAASLAGLTPVQAGRFLVHGAHDRAQARHRIGIEIEAALAFGTGHHGTTRGCLIAFDRLLRARRPRAVLDLGTGSGVLAIAAAKTLRCPVLASDNDIRAVQAARGNARLNRTAGFIEVRRAQGVTDRRMRQRAPFDLVFANILLTPLKLLAAPMARLLAPNARVVLSGLLPVHANAALAAYRLQGLVLERRITLDGWTTLVLARQFRSHDRHTR